MSNTFVCLTTQRDMATTLPCILRQLATILTKFNTNTKKSFLQGRWYFIKGHTIGKINENGLFLLRRKMVNRVCKYIKETILINLIGDGIQQILIRVPIGWIKTGAMRIDIGCFQTRQTVIMALKVAIIVVGNGIGHLFERLDRRCLTAFGFLSTLNHPTHRFLHNVIRHILFLSTPVR